MSGCQIEMSESNHGKLILKLDSNHIHSCGLTRLQNKVTGTKIFYHRLIIEERRKSFAPKVMAPDVPKDSNQSRSNSEHSHSNSAIGHLENHETFDHIETKSTDILVNKKLINDKLINKSFINNDEDYTDIIQETLVIKCVIPGQHSRLKRQSGSGSSFPIWELPDNFTESSE